MSKKIKSASAEFRARAELRKALEDCRFDMYGCLYSMAEARKVVVAARKLLGMPPMPEY